MDGSEDQESSSSSEEDSDAELLNPTVEKKFLQLMEAIRTNDPKLTATDKPHFDDADFDEQKGVKSKQSKPLMTLKD